MSIDHPSARAVLTDALAHAVDAYLMVDAQANVLEMNAAAEWLFGRRRQAMLGRPLTQWLPGLPLAAGASHEGTVDQPDGRRRWVSLSVSPLAPATGDTRLICARDVTLARMLEAMQHKALHAIACEQPLQAVMQLVCDDVERIAPEVIASILAVDEGGRLHPLAGPSLPESYARALDGLEIGPAVGSCGSAAYLGEPVLVSDIASDPRWAPYRGLALPLGLAACWSSPIKGRNGRVIGTFAFYFREPRGPDALHARLVDVCVQLCALALEREESNARLHRLAFFDPLCGLPNRALTHTLAERALADAERAGTPLAALFIDLDRFKLINDAQGHAAGDALLCEVSRRLIQQARASDIVGRLAGDEFIVLLPRSDAPQAAIAAERLLEALARPVDTGGLIVNPSASVGIALFPEDGRDVDTLLRHADLAMARAKADGLGAFRFFRAEMNDATHERMLLEVALRAALQPGAADPLRLHFQPKVAAHGAPGERPQPRGAEALLRWTHPSLGPIPPDRLIALAEDCGLIADVGRWVLAQACRQLGQWRRRGVPVESVAVNLSARNFRDPLLPSVVAELLHEHGLDPQDLTLEITESVMLDADQRVLAIVDQMRAIGVPLSLDDFGTGYSSLSVLHRLPIRELKLDKSFVRDIEDSDAARALIQSVLRIGESLKLTVVAEGVETAAQRDFLAARGCPVLQGYLFARPMPPAELEAWLAPSTLSLEGAAC